MMPTLTTAASDPGRGSARDPLLFLLLAFFLLAYGESTVLASLNRSAGRLLCPTRRADDENGVRRWSDDDGNVCRDWISGTARPEPVEHVVSPLMVMPMHRSVACPLCPLRRAGDENGKRRLIGVVIACRVI